MSQNSALNNTAMEKRIKELKKKFDIDASKSNIENTEEEVIEIVEVNTKRTNKNIHDYKTNTNRQSKTL